MVALPERINELHEELITTCCMVKTFAAAAFSDDCESGDLGASLEHLHGIMLALVEDSASISDEVALIDENKGIGHLDTYYTDKWEEYISDKDKAAHRSEEAVEAVEKAISFYRELPGKQNTAFTKILLDTGAAFRKQGFMEGYRAAVEMGCNADGE